MSTWLAAVACLAIVIAPSVSVGRGASASARGAARPNILIIVTDDQREGMDVMFQTRALFEQSGLAFTSAFATTPLCCPARTSIFTGRYAHNHGVKRNRDVSRLNHRTTLQRYLDEVGYTTGIFGKYLNAWRLREDPPYFDSWAIFPQSKASTYLDGTWNVNGQLKTVESYSTTFIRRQAARFLRRAESRDGRPWFLYLATPAAHAPFTPQPKYAEASVPSWEGNPAVSEEDHSDKPAYVQARNVDHARGDEVRTKQLRTLMSVDDMVGQVYDTIKSLGENRRTLALFVSDNGYMWGEHGTLGKKFPYTESVRVPMFLRWPDRVAAGIDQRLVANIDIAPTVMDATGLVPARPMDGRSLLDPSWDRDRILLEYWGDPPPPRIEVPTWASIRMLESQFVEYYGEDDVTPISHEYYDLVEDPWQLTNLLGEGQESTGPGVPDQEALSAALQRDRSCRGTRCP